MFKPTLGPLDEGFEKLIRNNKGFYTLIERCDEEIGVRKKFPTRTEAEAEAIFLAVQNNPGVDPKKYNKSARDGLDVYYDVYSPEGSLIYTGEIPETRN